MKSAIRPCNREWFPINECDFEQTQATGGRIWKLIARVVEFC